MNTTASALTNTSNTGCENSLIPVSVALWDVAHIAAFFCRAEAYVKEAIIPLPTFPKAIRLPTGVKRPAHALYEAAEVIAWAKQFKEPA